MAGVGDRAILRLTGLQDGQPGQHDTLSRRHGRSSAAAASGLF